MEWFCEDHQFKTDEKAPNETSAYFRYFYSWNIWKELYSAEDMINFPGETN